MLLLPSKPILDAIGWDRNAHVKWTEIGVQGFSDPAVEFGRIEHIVSYLEGVKDFYSGLYGITLTEYFLRRQHFDLVNDGLANACKHGSVENTNSTTPYSHGAFFARKGICSGFRDQGGYFQRPEIKTIFEAKDMDALKKIQPEVHYGTMFEFELSDLIEVDTEHGILYCAQLLKPEHIERIDETDWDTVTEQLKAEKARRKNQ